MEAEDGVGVAARDCMRFNLSSKPKMEELRQKLPEADGFEEALLNRCLLSMGLHHDRAKMVSF